MTDKPSVTEALVERLTEATQEWAVDRDAFYEYRDAKRALLSHIAALEAASLSQPKPGEVGELVAELLPTEGTELGLTAQDGAHEQDTTYIVKSRQALWQAAKDAERVTKERDVERKHVARLMRDLEWNRKRATEAADALSASLARAEALALTISVEQQKIEFRDKLIAKHKAQIATLTAERGTAESSAAEWQEAANLADDAVRRLQARLSTVEKETARRCREIVRDQATYVPSSQEYRSGYDDGCDDAADAIAREFSLHTGETEGPTTREPGETT